MSFTEFVGQTMTAGVSGMVCSALTNNDSGGEWDGAFSSDKQ